MKGSREDIPQVLKASADAIQAGAMTK
jgi:hypothetical protein